MSREPWDGGYRLGIKMGPTAGNPYGELAIGMAMVRLGPKALDSGEDRIAGGDPMEAILARLHKEMAARPGFAGIDLYVYANRAAFKGSRPDREGMNLTEHTNRVHETAAALRLRGIDVKIVEVKGTR